MSKPLFMGNEQAGPAIEKRIKEIRECFSNLSGVQQGCMGACGLTKAESDKEWRDYERQAKEVVEDLVKDLLKMGVDFKDYNDTSYLELDEIKTVGELKRSLIQCEDEEPLYFVKKGTFTIRDLRCIGVGFGAGGRASSLILE